MFKPHVQTFSVILVALAIALAASGAQAAQTDPLTRLALYPGIKVLTTDSQDVCGTKVRNATYSAVSGNLATFDRWYAGHLSGFKVVHGSNRNYPYDVFINSDATMSVSVLGSGPQGGVEAVIYHRNAKPASVSNLTNWLDGSDPLCR